MENALEALCLSETAHEELHTQTRILTTTKKGKKTTADVFFLHNANISKTNNQ